MTTITQVDKANADKAFDIAFRGDTDGIDTAMAELFARARLEGAKAMQAVEPALYQLRHHQQQADMDGTFVTVSRQALDEVLDAIAALDPAQIAAQEPKP